MGLKSTLKGIALTGLAALTVNCSEPVELGEVIGKHHVPTYTVQNHESMVLDRKVVHYHREIEKGPYHVLVLMTDEGYKTEFKTVCVSENVYVTTPLNSQFNFKNGYDSCD